MPSHVYVGVDLGGTRIRAAAVSSTGTIDKIRQRPTQSDRPAMHIVEDVVELVREVAPVGLAGIGVGVPTTLDERGWLRPCLNLPTFGSFNLGAELQTRLNTKVQLENDARCFTLGEWAWGAARGVRIAVGLTLGTSVGLGIVVDGVPFRGAHGDAGEIWRSPTRSTSQGCPESILHDLLGGHAITRLFEDPARSGIDAAAIAERAVQGDREAITVFERYGADLGIAVCWICDILDPDRIVIGGAVATSFDFIRPSVAAAIRHRRCNIVTSSLGDKAAILGSVSLVRGK